MTDVRLPKHVAIIMDGNGRWAQARGLPRVAGHQAGVEAVRRAITAASKSGVEYLSLFAFSRENWSRPKQEVSFLMRLFLTVLKREVKELHKNNVRLKIIGELSEFSVKLQHLLNDAMTLTADNTGLTVIIAANYSGRWDIARAAREVAKKVEAGELAPQTITEAVLDQHLVTYEFPEPDLLIRTSGESRISNFYLWQASYTELVFVDDMWPDFTEKTLLAAIEEYTARERRYGKLPEQLEVSNA